MILPILSQKPVGDPAKLEVGFISFPRGLSLLGSGS